jgi:DNA-3-methyladenine glycosylase I
VCGVPEYIMLKKQRCPWVNLNNPEYIAYHDKEWGKPVHDDRHLFEMLILEGAQAGLSWEIVLKKRKNYRRLFANFDPVKVAKFTPAKISKLLTDPSIIRNRLKIESTINNAKMFIEVQKEFGSFDHYLWQFVDHQPIVNTFSSLDEYPTKTKLSDQISRDLKKRGFRFVGSTIIYAYLQAVGVVNDHTLNCYKRTRKQQSWFVYIIQTAKGTYYTGIALNVEKRFQEHKNSGLRCAKYLRGKGPLTLVYQQRFENKSAALKREYEIKQLSKKHKEALINRLVKPHL